MRQAIASRRPFRPNGGPRAAEAAANEQAPRPTSRPLLAVVVPTRNEAANIAPLVERIEGAVDVRRTELVFVDDSSDETPAEIECVARDTRMRVRMIHRPGGERRGGLGGAVAAGLRSVDATWACVIDGDLQHPPELIPVLLEEGERRNSDLVIASRYCVAPWTNGLGICRIAVSRGLTALTRGAFPRRLGAVSDPLSGFFLVRLSAVELRALRPRGFKVLLEILVRSPRLRTSDVPFEFGDRYSGESKATIREGLTFISHLICLRFHIRGRSPSARERRESLLLDQR